MKLSLTQLDFSKAIAKNKQNYQEKDLNQLEKVLDDLDDILHMFDNSTFNTQLAKYLSKKANFNLETIVNINFLLNQYFNLPFDYLLELKKFCKKFKINFNSNSFGLDLMDLKEIYFQHWFNIKIFKKFIANRTARGSEFVKK